MRLLLPSLLPQSVSLLLETSTFVTKVGGMECAVNCHEGGFTISVLPASADVMGRRTTESSEGTCCDNRRL